MGNKHKAPKAAKSLTSAIIVSVIAATILSVALSALLASLILNGSLSEKAVGTAILAVRSVSLLAGALVGGAMLKQKILPQVGFTALGYLLVLLGIGIVFYDGSFNEFWSGIASVLVGGTGAFVILLRSTKQRTHRPKKFSR